MKEPAATIKHHYDLLKDRTIRDIIGIPLLDHVVVGAQDHPALPRFYSFASNGLL